MAVSVDSLPKADFVPHRAMITASAIGATLLQSLDQTIANVALPFMQGSFSASYNEITWVLTSYITAAAIMTAPVGWMVERYGRKQLFVACIVGFTIASMLCGAAQSLTQIVDFRLLQGAFSAALVPLAQTTRGIGNFAAIMISGRLVNRGDPRYLVGLGLVMMCASFYVMTGWTPNVFQRDIILTIVLQGAGLGLVFMPLQILAFATLPPALRTEGAALFSLLRNMGAAIGVSVTSTVCTQRPSPARGDRSQRHALRPVIGGVRALNPTTHRGAAMPDRLISQQAEIIAYVDDSVLLIYTTLPAILLLLLMRRPKGAPTLETEPVEQ